MKAEDEDISALEHREIQMLKIIVILIKFSLCKNAVNYFEDFIRDIKYIDNLIEKLFVRL